MVSLQKIQEKNLTQKQVEFRNRKRVKGLSRANAIYKLMKVHNLNLPGLEQYINLKDEEGLPLHKDITLEILPDLRSTISRARLQQILSRSEEYKTRSSWKTTREKAKKSHLLIS